MTAREEATRRHLYAAGVPVPAITRDEMVAVDRLTIESFGVSLVQMMENAGRSLALRARGMLGGPVAGAPIVVAAGKGNNGGGGLAAARHLANWGAGVTVLLPACPLSAAPEAQRHALERMGLEIRIEGEALGVLADRSPRLVLDALIGYGLSGAPRGRAAALVGEINGSPSPVLSLDVPSGLDATTGTSAEPCVRADSTLTLALPKTGFLAPAARTSLGALYLADIGVPAAVYSQLDLEVGPLFAQGPILELDFEP